MSRRSKKKGPKGVPPEPDFFDPDFYEGIFLSLMDKAKDPKYASRRLLAQMHDADPTGLYSNRLTVADLDRLEPKERGAVTAQLLEQDLMCGLGKNGYLDALEKAGFITIEVTSWDKYAQEYNTEAIEPLKDLSATVAHVRTEFLAMLELAFGVLVRKENPDIGLPDSQPAVVDLSFMLSTLMNPSLLSDIPGAKARLERKDKGNTHIPYPTTMYLAQRAAMILFMHLVNRDKVEARTEALVKALSGPLFMILYHSNYTYTLWNAQVKGKPFTRIVDKGGGNLYFVLAEEGGLDR
jgi:hypothetical protein